VNVRLVGFGTTGPSGAVLDALHASMPVAAIIKTTKPANAKATRRKTKSGAVICIGLLSRAVQADCRRFPQTARMSPNERDFKCPASKNG
jgi:hypothetical protein